MANSPGSVEREHQARLLLERGGPLPNERRRQKFYDADGIYSAIVNAAYPDPYPEATPDPTPTPRKASLLGLSDDIDPDSVIQYPSGDDWKSIITCVDVSLAGNGNHRHLSIKEVSRLYTAIAYANRRGMVFNAHITISWGMLGIGKRDHTEAANALKVFCKGLLTWARYYGLSPGRHEIAYVYVHEVSSDFEIHTHVLVSVPQKLREKLISWAPKGVRGISKVRDIPVKAVHVVSPGRSKPHIEEQWRWFSYLCKGIDPLAIVTRHNGQRLLASFLLHHKLNAPGEVWCRKMVGVSSNIAESAQKEFGFVSAWQLRLFYVQILYSDYEYQEWRDEQAAIVLRDLNL